MERHNKKCNLACGWQIKGECFKPVNTECRGPLSPAKDIKEVMLEATKSYENGITLTAEKFENWDISDDLHMETSPFKVVAERMANGYDRYIAEQLIKPDIDPDVLMHQQLEINRLKKEIHWWRSQYEDITNELTMAKEDLKHTCTTCFYMETPSQEMPCRDCRSFNKWKWRGDEDDSE